MQETDIHDDTLLRVLAVMFGSADTLCDGFMPVSCCLVGVPSTCAGEPRARRGRSPPS